MKTTLGGDRIGSGNKQEISLRNYERSTHDLGYIWRSSMASGTLVPFMSELALPGDTFDIDLNCDVKTLPTIGPLFGSYKVQLDVFECPIRLFQGKLHMNMMNVGMEMKNIKLPQYELIGTYDPLGDLDDNQQVNSSSIYSYLNVRGIGRTTSKSKIKRQFNAVPLLSYWRIFKDYYSNKMEEDAYVIHAGVYNNDYQLLNVNTNAVETWYDGQYEGDCYDNPLQVNFANTQPGPGFIKPLELALRFEWDHLAEPYGKPDVENMKIIIDGVDTKIGDNWETIEYTSTSNFGAYSVPGKTWYVKCRGYVGTRQGNNGVVEFEVLGGQSDRVDNQEKPGEGTPQLHKFPLENIDKMTENLLMAVQNPNAVILDGNTIEPYGLGLNAPEGLDGNYEETFAQCTQEGLALKTYQSDLFNNWVRDEWITGDNGVNEISRVLVEQDSQGDNYFTMDALNMSQKVYNMLNRIAVSGGTYDDWLDAVYTHDRAKSVESPVYHGSLIKELGFEEVVSSTNVEGDNFNEPLGTLAGRGKLTGKHKGGKVRIKTHEPSYILGIVSITPRVDYSQGNKWDNNLKTLDDLHKPALDEIGFQDLVTDQMAWFDTIIQPGNKVNYLSAGKQPAWINYMTNVNQVRGNFAEKNKEMYMTLNRRYEHGKFGIEDLTTYVDPSKFNHIFSDVSLSSQNFWVQIGVKNTARRKMSAKLIPNL